MPKAIHLPNAINAQKVLQGPFDMEVHRLTFFNYLEVVMSPEGVVEYAVPSHNEKLLQIYMKMNSIPDRESAFALLDKQYGRMSMGAVELLSKATGYISIWNDIYTTGVKLTDKQLRMLQKLKVHGLYRGPVRDLFVERQEELQRYQEIMEQAAKELG